MTSFAGRLFRGRLFIGRLWRQLLDLPAIQIREVGALLVRARLDRVEALQRAREPVSVYRVTQVVPESPGRVLQPTQARSIEAAWSRVVIATAPRVLIAKSEPRQYGADPRITGSLESDRTVSADADEPITPKERL